MCLQGTGRLYVTSLTALSYEEFNIYSRGGYSEEKATPMLEKDVQNYPISTANISWHTTRGGQHMRGGGNINVLPCRYLDLSKGDGDGGGRGEAVDDRVRDVVHQETCNHGNIVRM